MSTKKPKRNRTSRRKLQAQQYAVLEARTLLAGVLANTAGSDVIADPFAYDAVTYKQMVDRAQVHSYVAGQLVIAIQTKESQGPHAIDSIDWGALTGDANASAKRTLMSVNRDGSKVISLVQVTLSEGADIFEAMRRLEGFRRVMWSSPNFSYKGDPREFVPNDPQYGSQYFHGTMSNPQAWDITLGSPNIVIAVTDDGVQLNHPDLQANIWQNDDFPFDGEDNDGNGYIDDFQGWDFSSNNNDPNPNSTSDTHGTHVSGISAGRTNNGVGIAGTAGGSKIMPLQFAGVGDWTAAVINQTFRYAADNGANIVNTSYNIDGWVGDPVFAAGLDYMYDRNVLHFNSAGNNSQLNPPRQAFEQTLLVASTDNGDGISSFSNYGTGVDLSAPGGGILSTVLGSGYDTFSGTSMATPNAAGAAALIWSAHPTWTRDQVAAALYVTADNINAQNPDKIGLMGGGRVNSFAGITATIAAPKVASVANLPANGTNVDDTSIDRFRVAFNQIMDPISVNTATNFELRSAGLNDLFGDGDDQVFTLSTTEYFLGTNSLLFTIGEGPMSYGHYQLKMTSGGLQNPFGTDLDGDANSSAGGDYVHTFRIAPPPRGVVTLDKSDYQVADTITITVGDFNAIAPVVVQLTTSNGDSENVTLTPQGNGKFTGTINTVAGAATPNNGALQVVLGTDITATYNDPDDGTGVPFTSTDTAVISNIRRYDSTDIPKNISDNSTVSSIISIPDELRIVDFEVELDITHTYDADLDVSLVAPDGTTVILFQDVGGSGDDFTETYLDDESGTSITTGTAPFTGRYRPQVSLTNFDSLNTLGNWTLRVFDDAGGDVGTLNDWAIIVDVRTFDAGVLTIDRPSYNIGSPVQISVVDANATGPVTVEVVSTRGDVETVTLTPAGGIRYVGSINTVAGTAANDGSLQVAIGDKIRVRYVDQDNGNGLSNTLFAHANVRNVVEYPSTNVPINILDNTTVTSTINIPNAGSIADLDLRLDITHTWDSDLDVFLISPTGTRIEMFQDIGGSGDNFNNTYLDDEAATAITSGTAPFTGNFRPVGSFSVVDGLSMTGLWTLEISDDAAGDTGTLNAWSLFIDAVPSVVVPNVIMTAPAPVAEGHTGSTLVNFTVSLSAPTSQAVFVDYSTISGSASVVSGVDYSSANGMLVFMPGETTKNVQVLVYGDRMMESHEQYGLELKNSLGGTVPVSSALATITDDEAFALGKPMDFGTHSSPIQSNAVGMMDMAFDATRKVGWVSGVAGLQFVDRGVGTLAQRDLVVFNDATFGIGVDNQRYVVAVMFGDATQARDQMVVYLEGVARDTVSTAAGQFITRRYDVRSFDGRIDLRIQDQGGVNNLASVALITVQTPRNSNMQMLAVPTSRQLETQRLEFVTDSMRQEFVVNDFKLAADIRTSAQVSSAKSKYRLVAAEPTTATDLASVSLLNEVWDDLAA